MEMECIGDKLVKIELKKYSFKDDDEIIKKSNGKIKPREDMVERTYKNGFIKNCLGYFPIPKYTTIKQGQEIGSYLAINEIANKRGCFTCPFIELCLKLKELAILDNLGQPGGNK